MESVALVQQAGGAVSRAGYTRAGLAGAAGKMNVAAAIQTLALHE